MEKKNNKYVYLWVVQGYYGSDTWEDLCQDESYSLVRLWLKDYNKNESGIPHRMISRRE